MSTDGAERVVWVDMGGLKPTTLSLAVKEDGTILRLLKAIFPQADDLVHRNVDVFKSDGTRADADEKISGLQASGQGIGENPLKLRIPSILCCGLPPLAPHSGSSSVSSSTHQGAECKERPFEMLTKDKEFNPQDIKRISMLWFQKGDKPLQWHSEGDVRDHVMQTLMDIAREAGIKDLTWERELSLFDRKRADVWVVCAYGVPIGVVEVKLPKNSDRSKSQLDDKGILGQLYDYVTHLRTYAGRNYAFGILSTYNEWRIMWLPESDEVARSTTVTPCEQRSYSEAVVPTDPPIYMDDSQSSNFDGVHVQQAQPAERIAHVSKLIYNFDDTSLPRILLSVTCKMMSSPVTPTSVRDLLPGRSYIYVTETTWEWRTISHQASLKIEGRVPSYFQNAYLLADLGGGGDGRVWLAATGKGMVCVLKFSSNEDMLKKEARIWNEAWGSTFNVQVKNLNGRPVLVMPWVKPCKEKDMKRQEVQEAVRKAVETLAKAGYRHDDLHPRHVGLYKQNSELKALLFDLARTSIVPKEEAIAQMLDDLYLNEETS